jgi:hypothetical protein
MYAKHATLLLLIALPLAAVLGCGGESESTPPPPPRSEVTLGPVNLAVQLDPSVPTLADRPTLTVTLDHPPGVAVEWPEFGPEFGDFRVVDVREAMPAVAEDREIMQYVYTLEPKSAGRAAIWPVDIAFTDARPDGDGKRHVLSSEPLAVEIATEVDDESPSLADLRPDATPVALPFSRLPLIAWTAGILAVLAVGAYVIRLRRRRKKIVLERPLTPAEIAYRDLQKIVDDDLAHQDVKLFYVAITGVVRRFIEQTTSIRAPEQTTEEFLREITARRTFPVEENRRLKVFLEAADLVKFAAHRPRDEDIDASLDRAREFIDARREAMAAAANAESADAEKKEVVPC